MSIDFRSVVGPDLPRDLLFQVGHVGGALVELLGNLELSDVEASDWRPRHDEPYREA
jgi:hypothetical protein